MNMLTRLLPKSWFADIDYDRTADIDYTADATWNEADHPRDAAGKFTRVGGGSPSDYAGSLPSPTTKHVASKASPKKLAQQVAAHLQAGGSPGEIAQTLKDYGAHHAYSGYASFANQLLSHVESAYGLQPGSLGKATNKQTEASPPSVVVDPHAEVEPTDEGIEKWASQAEAESKAVGEPDDPGAALGEASTPETKQMASIMGSDWPDDEKKEWIAALKADLHPNDDVGHAHAQAHLDLLNGMTQPAEAQTGATEQPLPELPEATTKSQAKINGIYTSAASVEEKTAAIQAMMLNLAHPPNAEYAAKALEALGGATEVKAAEAEAPAAAAPEPPGDPTKLSALPASLKGTAAESATATAGAFPENPELALKHIKKYNEGKLAEGAYAEGSDVHEHIMQVQAALEAQIAAKGAPADPNAANKTKVQNTLMEMVDMLGNAPGLSPADKIAGIKSMVAKNQLAPEVFHQHAAAKIAELEQSLAAKPAAPPHPLGKPEEEMSQAEYDAYVAAIPKPSGQDQKDMWEVAQHPQMTLGKKIGQLESDKPHFEQQTSNPAAQKNNAETVEYIDKLLNHLKGDLNAAIPTPAQGVQKQSQIHYIATDPFYSTKEKIAKIQEVQAVSAVKANVLYGESVLAALSGKPAASAAASATPATAPAPEPIPTLPDPKPGSSSQQKMHAAASDPNTKIVQKIEAIKLALAESGGSAGGAAETYANELLAAHKAAPTTVQEAKALQAATTPSIVTPQVSGSTGTPPPQTLAQKAAAAAPKTPKHGSLTAPPNAQVTQAAAGPDLSYALKYESEAANPHSTNASEAYDIVPSLKPEFWQKIDSGKDAGAFDSYGGGGFVDINGVLRGNIPKTKPTMDKINAMRGVFHDDAVAITQDLRLIRGEEMTKEQHKAIKDALESGTGTHHYMRKGFTSASIGATPGYKAGANTWWQFTVRKGQKVLGIAGKVGHHEREVVLNHGISTEIYEMYHDGKRTIIKAIVG